MAFFDNIDKARCIVDSAPVIAEIQKIIGDYRRNLRIDRQDVERIIIRLNSKDAALAGFNSPLNPGWVTFQDAADEQIVENLNITLLYLSGKMTAEGLKARAKGDKNNDTLN